jgi:hypothetical protein
MSWMEDAIANQTTGSVRYLNRQKIFRDVSILARLTRPPISPLELNLYNFVLVDGQVFARVQSLERLET